MATDLDIIRAAFSHISYLEDFRTRFGSTLNNIKEEDFIEWCGENEVILYKFVTNTVEVKIEDY